MSIVFKEIVTIVNKKGLHARAAAKLVKCAEKYNAQIELRRIDAIGEDAAEWVGATSILGLMMLAAETNTELEIVARGEDAHEAISAIRRVIERKFDEDG